MALFNILNGATNHHNSPVWRYNQKEDIIIDIRSNTKKIPDWENLENGIEIDKDTQIRRYKSSLNSTYSTLEEINGLFILHLHGNPYERGKAHGKLLEKEILESNILDFYSRQFVYDLLKNEGNDIKKLLGKLIIDQLYSSLERRCLEEIKYEIYGITESVGLDKRKGVHATFAPDIMEHLAAGFLLGEKESLGNYYLGGCSSFYVRKEALKKNSGALFARNMDFPGVFTWIYPTLIFSHPTEKLKDINGTETNEIKQPYMYISTAGFSGYGITGMNAKGIAIANFVCLSKNYSRKKIPMLSFNHYLLTRIKTLDDIKTLLKEEKLKSASPHIVVFADKDNVVSLEVDSSRNIIRTLSEDFDTLIQTNHFFNLRMKKKEFEYPVLRENSSGRYNVMKNLIDEYFGRIGLQDMVNIISSNLDLRTHKSMLIGDFPAQTTTLTSAIFELGTGNFWVASGKPPAVCYNTYEGFNFYNEINGNGWKTRLPSYHRSNQLILNNLRVSTEVTDTMKRSQEFFVHSEEELNNGNIRNAIENLENAIQLHSEPTYYYVKSILHLMNDQAEKALDIIRFVKRNFDFPIVKKSALSLLEGWCFDILGKREEAIACYNNALKGNTLVNHLEKAFKYYKKKPFSLNKLKSIEYSWCGPLKYY